MSEMIKIGKNNVGGDLIETVNACDLHSFLESSQEFSKWIKTAFSNNNQSKED